MSHTEKPEVALCCGDRFIVLSLVLYPLDSLSMQDVSYFDCANR